jgi:ABC-type multidrug transport system ATPase subunit
MMYEAEEGLEIPTPTIVEIGNVVAGSVSVGNISAGGVPLDVELAAPAPLSNTPPAAAATNNSDNEPWPLIFRNLTKVIYTKNNNDPKTVLAGASGMALPGEVVGIMGLSGSGKTTLLRLLGGRDLVPHQGEVFVKSIPLNSFLRRRIAFIPQFESFLPSKTLTAREQLTLVACCRTSDKVSLTEVQGLVHNTLSQLNILQRADTPLRFLSGGERKRVSIGCELITNPKVLLIDEATSNLDSASVKSFMALVRRIAVTNNIPVVMTIHQPSSAAFFSFDRILLLFRSRVIFLGSPRECEAYFQRFRIREVTSSNVERANFAEQMIDYLFCQQVAIVLNDNHAALTTDEIDYEAAAEVIEVDLAECWKRTGEQRVLADIAGQLTLAAGARGVDRKTLLLNWLVFCPSALQVYLREAADKVFVLVDVYDDCKAPSSTWRQTMAVARRSLMASPAAQFTRSNMIHTVLMAVLAGMIWFQMKMVETRLADFASFLTFVTTYYFFSGFKSGILLYHPERVVFRAERLMGTYSTLSFLLGRFVSLLPVRTILPTIFVVISYLMAIAEPRIGTVFLLAFITVSANVTGESIGVAIATTTESMDAATSNGIVIALVSFLLGGSFVQMIPVWLDFLSDLSAYRYLYEAAVLAVLSPYRAVVCNDHGETITACVHRKHIPMSLVTAHVMHVDNTTVGWCLLILLAYNAGMMFFTYLILVFVDKKRSQQ